MYSQRYAHRHEQLIERMRAHNLDALALVPGPNMYYITGLSFHLSERPIVAIFREDGHHAIVLPKLEAAKNAKIVNRSRYATIPPCFERRMLSG